MLKRPPLGFHIYYMYMFYFEDIFMNLKRSLESEANDSWIPHLAYVSLNKPMVMVDALAHSNGGTARQAFHFRLYDY